MYIIPARRCEANLFSGIIMPMNTLLTTNILLLVVVVAIAVLAIMLGMLLYHLIGTTRRIKHLVTVFDDDVIRARSVILALKDKIADILSPKKSSKHHSEK